MVLLNDGKVLAWGSNASHQLGVEGNSTDEVPEPTIAEVDEIRMVACGYEHTLFLDKNGDIYGCGKNDQKQLIFQSNNKTISAPTLIQTPERVKKIFASSFSALITEKDDLYVWGGFLSEIIDMTNPFEFEEFLDQDQKDPQYSNMSS